MIVKYLKNRGIEYLYHATPLNNLNSIVDSKAILSRNFLSKNNISYSDVDSSRHDGKLDYISCSYNDINDRYFSSKGYSLKNNLVRFKIKINILKEMKALFFHYNAASDQFKSIDESTLSSLDFLKYTFADNVVVQTKSRGEEVFYRNKSFPQNIPTTTQAEVMIFKEIPISFIEEVYAEFELEKSIITKLTNHGVKVVDLSGSNEELLQKQIERNENQYKYFELEDNQLIDQEYYHDFKEKELNRNLRNIKNKTTYFSSLYEINNKRTYGQIKIINLLSSFRSNSISKYKQFYAVFYNFLNKGYQIKPSRYILDNLSSIEKTNYVLGIQFLILNLIKNGTLNDQKWSFNVPEEYENIVKIAINDIFDFVEMITRLTNVNFVKPKIIFDDYKNSIRILFNEYPNRVNEYSVFYNKQLEKNIMYFPFLWVEEKIKYQILPDSEEHINILTLLLNQIFGYDSFRSLQIDILANYLNGNNTIGILPTGHGKSLIFYFAILLQPVSSIIVAPINALILDQIRKLKKNYKINRYINLTRDNKNMNKDMERFHNSLFTFLSPERLQTKSFRKKLVTLYNMNFIGQVILDEVHCLSEWGHDFRVSYLMLAETLNTYCENINYLGLTATAQIKVIQDLRIELNINDYKNVIFSKQLKRENLTFVIEEVGSVDDVKRSIKERIDRNYGKNNIYNIESKSNAIVVFTQTKSEYKLGTRALYNYFVEDNADYIRLMDIYNGDKKDSFEPFMNNKKRLLFATKAFGMGVDKLNIRMTMHAGMPASREAYYQEAGRAGRDERNSYCWLYTIKPPKEESNKIDSIINNNSDPHEVSTQIDNSDSYNNESDIWTPFYFFRKSFNSPEEETNKVSRLYNEILNGITEFVDEENNDLTYKEKDLYVLHKIGIIKNWTVIWRSDKVKIYVVDINHENLNNFSQIKKNAIKYITSYENEEITEFEREFTDQIDSAETFEEIIYPVRKWYHKTFVDLKLQQIKNMYRFINEHKIKELEETVVKQKSIEIQSKMDAFFDLSNLLHTTIEGYNLEFRNNSLEDVIKFAFELTQEKLERRIIELDRLLESVQNNTKTEIYYGILNLRFDLFTKNKGMMELNRSYQRLSEQDKLIFLQMISKEFINLNFKEKNIFAKVLELTNKEIEFMYQHNYNDDYLLSMIHHYINEELKGVLGGIKHD